MKIERTIINIYLSALERSITGDIISMIRFMPHPGSQLKIIAADVYNFNKDLCMEFCETLTPKEKKGEAEIQEEFKKMLLSDDYNRQKYKMLRVFNLVIEGERAVERMHNLMGNIKIRDGVTIFGRYGFFKKDDNEKIIFAEFPASSPANIEEAEAQIDLLWNKYKHLGGPLENSIIYPEDKEDKVERSLVVIKPNAFNNPQDPRIGDVIDAISKTGMYIIAAKVITPTKEDMMEFYAPHKGKHFYDELVDFMSEKQSLALMYEGIEARRKIREAALDVIRRVYSDSILENTIHTSENEEDYIRESRIVNFNDNRLIDGN
jgi:nucleoside-diphosphate kinase